MDDDSTLSQIFAKDPLELTKDDLAKTVAFFREQRVRFKAAQSQPKAAAKKPKNINPAQISLEDLGL